MRWEAGDIGRLLLQGGDRAQRPTVAEPVGWGQGEPSRHHGELSPMWGMGKI